MSASSPPFKPFSTNIAQQETASGHGEPDDEIEILTTAIVEIEDSRGCRHLCRAFIDQGSTSCHMTYDIAEKLDLKKTWKGAVLKGITGKPTLIRHAAKTKIYS